jgi:hypothetical protein
MQTKSGTSQPSGTNPLAGDVSLGHFARRKPTETDKAAGGKPTAHFLSKVFRPIPAVRLNPLFTRESYDSLYQSVRNYSTLLGSSFDFTPKRRDFLRLFRCFKKLLPEGQQLLLIERDGKLSFKIGFGSDFLIGEVFFIPIKILNSTEGRFRDILLSFFQHFFHAHRFPKKEHLFDYELIVEHYFSEWYKEDEAKEHCDFLTAYKEGYIHDTFSLIYQKPCRSTEKLSELIKCYTPRNSTEEKLLAVIRQGISILDTEKNIFDYVHHPTDDDCNFRDADDDINIIEADRLLRFVYSSNDYVSEGYLQYLNAELDGSVNEYFHRNSLILTPETDRLLEVDFVERFFSWLCEFIINLYNYENK